MITNCVHANGADIEEMMYDAVEISYDDFKAGVGPRTVQDFASCMGYNSDFKLEDDYHVSYYEATYRGKPVLVCQHSSIEYIFEDERR